MTLLNATFHPFFNFTENASKILQHDLKINATNYTAVDENCVANEVHPVKGTPFDFTVSKKIGACIEEKNEQLERGIGYDHNFCIDGEGFREAAVLSFETIKMTISSN